MELKTLTDLTADDVLALVKNYQILLFSPRLRNRNALLAQFIPTPGAYYYTLSPEDTTLPQLLQGLAHGLQDISHDFGSEVTQALGQRKTKPADFADALLADLKRAKPAPAYLILDGLDVLDLNADTVAFFQRLCDALPRTLHLIINSRILSYDPWLSLVHAGKAFVIGEENALGGGIFDPHEQRTHHLEVYSFSTGSVFVDGIPIDSWDGPLPRNLFFYFIDHPMVTRDEIFETFWPELNTKEATNVFHVTKRKVSERLGFELTAYAGGFYRPSKQMKLHYDVAHFEENYQLGQKATADLSVIETWYKAIRLYRNEFLHNFDMPWINERREHLKLEYVEALVNVARIYKALNKLDDAIHYYLRSLRQVPTREDIHRELMTLYEQKGERHKALSQYQALKEILQRTLHIGPSKATVALFDMLSGSR
jgi:DNA-binding SARP family transcriptional activator